MDAKMANFIGIHMLNEIIDTGTNENELHKVDNQPQSDGQYIDPDTGAHFEYKDLVRRINLLQKRRAIID